jgi:predicted RNase H-like nuclease (RuvC/YqgF family)
MFTKKSNNDTKNNAYIDETMMPRLRAVFNSMHYRLTKITENATRSAEDNKQLLSINNSLIHHNQQLDSRVSNLREENNDLISQIEALKKQNLNLTERVDQLHDEAETLTNVSRKTLF